MRGKARREPSDRFLAKLVLECFAGVGAKSLQNQMDGIGSGVLFGDLQDEIGEFKRGAVGVTLVK